MNECEARGRYEMRGGGGGGVLSVLGPIQKRGGGGGAVRFRPDTKSGRGGAVCFWSDTKSRGGGGGGGDCLPYDDLYLGLCTHA